MAGVWHLSSARSDFGGYSALLATGGDTLTAISDVGLTLRMRRPGAPGGPEPRFGQVRTPNSRYRSPDIEAATIDPRTGRRWYAYEYSNRIRRFDSGNDGTSSVVAPPAMRSWPANGGPESLARLPDGRFIVLSEDPPWLSTGERPGLLFPADPVTGVAPLEFGFRPPIGYAPSDMAALPDGRVLILLRTIDPLPPFFKGMLVVADPAAIAAGREWPWRKLADLSGPVPRDNYEGLAIASDATGVTIWVISDDNFARIQRTLLLQLHWRPGRRPEAPPAN